MDQPEVLIFSTYESYLQPMLLASIGGIARAAGMSYKLVDLSVDAFDPKLTQQAKAFVITIPLFDSLGPSCTLAANLHSINPGAAILFVGPHAVLNRQRLKSAYYGEVVENPEAELRDRLVAAGVVVGQPSNYALTYSYRQPDRENLPPLHAYSYPGGLLDNKIVGNVETSLGCRFACTHCTVYTLARQQVDYRAIEHVLTDIRAMVDQGANHITFMDAEFMNNGDHGPAVIKAMHSEFPTLTFDMISRVDRILKFESSFRRFFDLGCTFVTTALEFPDDQILRILRKGYRAKDLAKLSELVATTNVRINPTLIVFTPWIDVPRIEAGERFLADSGLSQIIDPIQFYTRLMITKGSPLLGTDALKGIDLTEGEFSYEWTHPDPAVDDLYQVRMREQANHDGFKRCCVRC